MGNSFFAFLSALLWVMICVCAKAQPVKLLIVTEHFPPFQMKTGDKITGFTTEVIQAALALTPYQYELALYPWSRSYNLALKKENTCIYSMARTKERESLFQWTDAISITNSKFIGLAGKDHISLSKISDAKNYHVAVLKDDFTQQLLLNHGFEFNKNLFVVNNPDSFLKLLMTREHIDLILTDDMTLHYRAQYDQLNPEMFREYLVLNEHPLAFYLACSHRTPPEVVTTLAKAIRTLKNNGLYLKIADKWQYPNGEAVIKWQPTYRQ